MPGVGNTIAWSFLMRQKSVDTGFWQGKKVQTYFVENLVHRHAARRVSGLRESRFFCPGGTVDNSPAIYRWVDGAEASFLESRRDD
jgi:hypothetical protein